MKLTPQLTLAFNGQCEAAFTTYARCMNGTIAFLMTWGESPAAGEVPAEWRGRIYHATLKVGDTAISGGDVHPDRYEQPKGFSVTLQLGDAEAADEIFATLSEQGRVDMPLQETFWAARFGAVVDRFGIPWQINCERPAEAMAAAGTD